MFGKLIFHLWKLSPYIASRHSSLNRLTARSASKYSGPRLRANLVLSLMSGQMITSDRSLATAMSQR